MRAWLRRLAVFALGGALGFVLLSWQLPSLIMSSLMSRVAAMGGVNQPVRPPLPDEKSRSVVLPSPDLAYVICAYDLSNGPLTVTFAPPALPYWSVAAYAGNTDNFLVVNDRAMPGGGAFVLGLADGHTPDTIDGKRFVAAPGARGVVLFRGLIANRDPALLKQVQDSVACQPTARP